MAKKKVSLDAFYTEARKILQTPKKRVIRGIKLVDKTKVRTPAPKTEFIFEGPSCMVCNEVAQVHNSIKGRMLKGLVQQTVEGVTVDPTTGRGVATTRVFPTYVTGRIHGKCLGSLKMILEPYLRGDGTYSTNPVRRDEVEILQERVTPREHRVITKQLVEMEDDGETAITEAEETKHVLHKCGVRTKVAKPYVPSDDEIDIKGYRRFGSHTRGGVKDYDGKAISKIDTNHGRFDSDVNYDNIKSPDKRWFKRG